MNKIYLGLLLAVFSLQSHAQTSIYDFKVKDISGGTIDLSSFRGKKILIVNVASASDRASQYSELTNLSQQYKETGLIVICFPSNDFNGEPKSDEDIKNFFRGTNSQFFLGKKLSVKGNTISPLYEWLTLKSKNGVMDVPVKGDYQKFLISSTGKLMGYFSGQLSPLVLERALK